MRETRVHGRLVTPDGVVDDAVVVVAGGTVVHVGPRHGSEPAVDAPARTETGVPAVPTDGWLLPGLVDVHCHGGGGGSFDVGGSGELQRAVDEHLRSGTTGLVASVVTDQPSAMLRAVAAAADSVEAGTLVGIHVEGPFLSAAGRGAQDARHLALPDVALTTKLLDAGRGHVRVMTIAPELPGATDVVEELLARGVVPAVGHTEADAGLVRRTLRRSHAMLGRPGLVTHLFNGMPPLHHRDPGPVAGALAAAAAGEAVVELVADGVHLHDETVRMVLALLGPDRVALVTDATAATGRPDGDYDLGSQRVRVRGGVARLGAAPHAPLAGGTTHLLDVVRRCVRAGVDLPAAVAAATRTPAAALGLTGVGTLRPGAPADLLVTDGDLRPVRVMRAGAWV